MGKSYIAQSTLNCSKVHGHLFFGIPIVVLVGWVSQEEAGGGKSTDSKSHTLCNTKTNRRTGLALVSFAQQSRIKHCLTYKSTILRSALSNQYKNGSEEQQNFNPLMTIPSKHWAMLSYQVRGPEYSPLPSAAVNVSVIF